MTDKNSGMGRRELIKGAGGLALMSNLGRSFAQSRMSTLKIVCPYDPGGTTDLLCRQVASKLSPGYADATIVENKSGAQGQLALAYVKGRPADGSYILQSPMSMWTVFPQVFKQIIYDPADYVPLTAGCPFEYAFAVGPMVPASVRTIQEYAAWTKLDPKNATFAAVGVLPTLTGSMMGNVLKLDLLPVQYKGGAPAAQDALAGNVPGTVSALGDILAYLGEGKLRILGTTGDKRNPVTPNAMTFSEQGLPDMVIKNFNGFFVHAKVAPDVIAAHSAAVRAALNTKEVSEALARAAMQVLQTDPKQAAELIQRERARWASLIARIGYKPT